MVVGSRFVPQRVTDNMDEPSPEEIDEMYLDAARIGPSIMRGGPSLPHRC